MTEETFSEYVKRYDQLNESLYGNRQKLYRMLDYELDKFDRSSEAFEDPSTAMSDDIIILRRSIYRYIKKERLAQIAKSCGYLASWHKADVWLTPENYSDNDSLHKDNFVIDEETGLRVAWHVSPIGNLDKKGIRCRSREKDPDFDIYHGRIYLMFEENDIGHAYEMVSNEKDNPTGHTYLYKILLPDGYKVYPDPTTKDGVFVTNNIPSKFITKIKDEDGEFDYEWNDEWLKHGKEEYKFDYEKKDWVKKLIKKAKNTKEINGIKLESTNAIHST